MRLLKSLTAFLAVAVLAAGSGVSVVWASGPSAAEQDLPDLGSPATAAVSLEEEYQVGQMWARQMRAQGMVLEDPEISDYIQTIGHSLSSHAEEGQHQFNYFVVRDPAINAFAMPGGFIAINSGLFLATRNENELAGVLAHETAHVTQRHLVRGMIDQTHAGLDLHGRDAGRHPLGSDRRPRRPERHGRRHSRRPERRHSASDQLHARPGIRGGPHRHRHHGERRLRSSGHGDLVRGARTATRRAPTGSRRSNS